MTARSPKADEPRAAQARCLLAEDDEVSQMIVQSFIQTLGFVDLTIAPDGRKALEYCMARKFDLLIVDRKMPHINGDKLIRHLHASRNPNSTTPVILFSASTGSELVDLGAHTRANMVITKPINSAEFLGAVRTLLRR